MDIDEREQEYLDLGGIQHFAFCSRQWALIHIECQWEENYLTTMGNIMHEKVHDEEFDERRGDVLISRGVRVHSDTLGIVGICDVVEFHKNDKDGVPVQGIQGKCVPIPVEYKRGKPKSDEIDLVQLVAQAMCLEEMMLCDVKIGYLYYGETRRRLRVDITDELKDTVKSLCRQMHDIYDRRHTPKGKQTKKCDACSLKNICLPKLAKTPSANEYIREHIKECEV